MRFRLSIKGHVNETRADSISRMPPFSHLAPEPPTKEILDRMHPSLLQYRASYLWAGITVDTILDSMAGLKTAIYLFGAILLAGCTTTKAPDVPAFQSLFGQACGRVCQREHALCTPRCTQMVKSGCISECNQSLKECYDFCLAGESKKSP